MGFFCENYLCIPGMFCVDLIHIVFTNKNVYFLSLNFVAIYSEIIALFQHLMVFYYKKNSPEIFFYLTLDK